MDASPSRDRRAAFEQGLVSVYPRLFGLAMWLCGNRTDAHDLVQDAVERGLRCRSAFRTGDTPDRWMSTILRRIFLDGYRSRRRRGLVTLEERGPRAAVVPTPEEPAQWEAFDLEDVQRALLFVDPAARETFALFAFEDLDQGEIARRLGISPHTVATRVFRTRAKLRELLVSGDHRRPLALIPPVADGGAATAAAPLPASVAPTPARPPERRRSARATATATVAAAPLRASGATA